MSSMRLKLGTPSTLTRQHVALLELGVSGLPLGIEMLLERTSRVVHSDCRLTWLQYVLLDLRFCRAPM